MTLTLVRKERGRRGQQRRGGARWVFLRPNHRKGEGHAGSHGRRPISARQTLRRILRHDHDHHVLKSQGQSATRALRSGYARPHAARSARILIRISQRSSRRTRGCRMSCRRSRGRSASSSRRLTSTGALAFFYIRDGVHALMEGNLALQSRSGDVGRGAGRRS